MIKDGGACRLRAGTRGGDHGDERLERVWNRQPLADWRIHKVVEVVVRVAAHQVCAFSGVNGGAAANGEESIDGAVGARPLARRTHRRVRRLASHLVVNQGFEATRVQGFHCPLECNRFGEPRIGHNGHTLRAEVFQVVPNLTNNATPKPQRRCLHLECEIREFQSRRGCGRPPQSLQTTGRTCTARVTWTCSCVRRDGVEHLADGRGSAQQASRHDWPEPAEVGSLASLGVRAGLAFPPFVGAHLIRRVLTAALRHGRSVLSFNDVLTREHLV